MGSPATALVGIRVTVMTTTSAVGLVTIAADIGNTSIVPFTRRAIGSSGLSGSNPPHVIHEHSKTTPSLMASFNSQEPLFRYPRGLTFHKNANRIIAIKVQITIDHSAASQP